MAGQLKVTIIEAKDLDREDTFQSGNDAYVEVYVDDDYKQRSKTIQDTTNPQWNQVFNFNVKSHDDHLHLKVYDDDGKAGRDSIGSTKIKLAPIRASGTLDEWVKITKKLVLPAGQVHVQITFTAD